MTRYLIAPDAEDVETLWDNTDPDMPEPIVSRFGVTDEVWSVLELLPTHSPERIRAAVELAEAEDIYDGAWSWANTARRNVALARYREVRTAGGPEMPELSDHRNCVQEFCCEHRCICGFACFGFQDEVSRDE